MANQERPEPFTTSDTALAAYLEYHRHTIVSFKPEKDDPRRLQYIFIKEDDTEKLVEKYESGRTVINIKQYANSLKHVYSKLKDYKDAQ